MKKKRNSGPIYKNSLTMDLLMLLLTAKTGGLQRVMIRQMQGLPWRETVTNKQVYTTLSKLRQKGWIEKKKINDEVHYKITQTGKVKHLANKSKTFSRTRGEQATVVIFDIPEEKRTYRNTVRRLLLNMDFTMLQRSVFITPYILPEEFYDYLREMKLLNYFQFIEGKIKTKI